MNWEVNQVVNHRAWQIFLEKRMTEHRQDIILPGRFYLERNRHFETPIENMWLTVTPGQPEVWAVPWSWLTLSKHRLNQENEEWPASRGVAKQVGDQAGRWCGFPRKACTSFPLEILMMLITLVLIKLGTKVAIRKNIPKLFWLLGYMLRRERKEVLAGVAARHTALFSLPSPPPRSISCQLLTPLHFLLEELSLLSSSHHQSNCHRRIPHPH